MPTILAERCSSLFPGTLYHLTLLSFVQTALRYGSEWISLIYCPVCWYPLPHNEPCEGPVPSAGYMDTH